MAELLTPDICVIGGGPAGTAMALRAARLGVPVVLVEKGAAGGSNLAWGAVPSKALVAASGLHEALRRGPALGVSGAPLQVNFARLAEHIRSVGEEIAVHSSPARLAALGVRVIEAPARFLDRRTVIADDITIIARRFVIATGALPSIPEIPGIDTVEPITFEEAYDLGRRPGHLLILGADGHALELAQAYQRLGVDSTVLSARPALEGEDPELAAIVLDRLKAEGLRIRDRASIVAFARRRGGLRVTLRENGEEIAVEATHLLIASGRRPNVADLALDAAGIAFGPDGIMVDNMLRTTNERVHAIGDVIPGPAVANLGEHQAEGLLRNLVYRLPFKYRPEEVPVAFFTDPGLARVGPDETTARKQDSSVRILRFPFAANDFARIGRMPEGLLKVVASKRGKVLGAAIAGHGASEQIALWSLALAKGLTVDDMLAFNPAYPSRSAIAGQISEASAPVAPPGQMRSRIIEFLRNFG